MLTDDAVGELERRNRRRDICCNGGRLVAAAALVDAAGVRADEVANRAGAGPLGLVPMRRSAVNFDAPSGADPATLTMVADADELSYLKPEGAALMASPGDGHPNGTGGATCLTGSMRRSASKYAARVATWSGRRTFAPDCAPVSGWEPEAPGFYWLAGKGRARRPDGPRARPPRRQRLAGAERCGADRHARRASCRVRSRGSGRLGMNDTGRE